MKTYSMSEVAEFLCGNSMEDPERWIVNQIIKKKRFEAIRVGRSYRMTPEQLARNVERISVGAAKKVDEDTKPAPAQPIQPHQSGLSVGSARRRPPFTEVAS